MTNSAVLTQMPKRVREGVKIIAHQLKNKKIEISKSFERIIKDERTAHLSTKKRISILEKRIKEYDKKINAYENKYDITSEEVLKIEPDAYSYSDDVTDWANCLFSRESDKSLLSALRKNG